MANPFDFVKAINGAKKPEFEDVGPEKGYIPYIINRAYAHHADIILHANEMNRHADMPKKWQYDYYRGVVRRGRYAPWTKKESKPEDVSVIQAYYKYNVHDAETALGLMPNRELQRIKEQIQAGGNNKSTI